jgi:hypothetical protein
MVRDTPAVDHVVAPSAIRDAGSGEAIIVVHVDDRDVAPVPVKPAPQDGTHEQADAE